MDCCTTCRVWLQQKKELLDECNSVWEAAARLSSFEQECIKKCLFDAIVSKSAQQEKVESLPAEPCT